MEDEPRDKRVPIMFTASELDLIDDWRFANRIGTRADAVRRLVTAGMVKNLKGLEDARGSRAEATELISSNVMTGIGVRIREARQKAGITQQELAEKLGVSQGSVSKWENGQEMPGADSYLKAMEACQ